MRTFKIFLGLLILLVVAYQGYTVTVTSGTTVNGAQTWTGLQTFNDGLLVGTDIDGWVGFAHIVSGTVKTAIATDWATEVSVSRWTPSASEAGERFYGKYINVLFTGSQNGGIFKGLGVHASAQHTAGLLDAIYSAAYSIYIDSAANITYAAAGNYVVEKDGAGTLVAGYALDTQSGGTEGTVTNDHTIRVQTPLVGATLTNHSGLLVQDQGSPSATNNSIRVDGDVHVLFAPPLVQTPVALSIPDSGDGSAATHTLTTPAASKYNVTCDDTDGCDETVGETLVRNGQGLCYVNNGANVVNFADTAGVTELAGAFAAGINDSICLTYVVDHWVEVSRSNN